MEKRSEVSLLSLGGPDLIISVNLEDHRKKHRNHPASHFIKCFLVSSYSLDHCGCQIMSAAVIFCWCSLASDVMLVPTQRFINQGKRPKEKSERVAQYIIHLQCQQILIFSANWVYFSFACPTFSVYLLWEIAKCFNFKVQNIVVLKGSIQLSSSVKIKDKFTSSSSRAI